MPVRIDDILVAQQALNAETSVSAALQRFVAEPDTMTLPVVFDDAPLGMVSRARIMELFVGTQSRLQLMRQPISRFIQREPVLAEVKAPAAYVARQLSQAEDGEQGVEGVIAVRDGRYAGTVSIKDMLAAVADENAARATAMKRQVQRLEAERRKSGVQRGEQARRLAFLSHEIRTPLTGILGVAELLEDANLPSETLDLARTISTSGRHLDRLLSDILDLSRLESGRLPIALQPFKLRDFAKETRTLWRGESKKKNIGLKVTVDDRAGGRIEADETRLRQILFNLIGNAMKFTATGSVTAQLVTRAGENRALKLEMTVTDTGIGISDADKARLFEAFEQATPRTAHRFGGAGLGLSIAKGLVAQMGGTIRLEDNPGGGTVFRVVCPVHKPGPRLAVENSQSRRAGHFQLGRVLLVEDHDVSRLVMTKALSAVGWRVDAVETVAHAKRRALEVPYQAVLLDLHLGDGAGHQVAEIIRVNAGPNRYAPLLAVTADVGVEQRARCERAGFDGFIEKPIRPRSLVTSLADAIVAHGETNPLRQSVLPTKRNAHIA